MLDLLTTLEDGKDQWLKDALDSFIEDYHRFIHQHSNFNLVDVDTQKNLQEITITPEDQVIEMKKNIHSVLKQQEANFNSAKAQFDLLEAAFKEEENALSELEAQIEVSTREITTLNEISFDAWALEEYPIEVIEVENIRFKDRKADQLKAYYYSVELEMKDFYQMNLDRILNEIKDSLSGFGLEAFINYINNPELKPLYLNHKSILNTFLTTKGYLKAYEEIHETLLKNNSLLFSYYSDQLTLLKNRNQKELAEFLQEKQHHHRDINIKIIERQAIIEHKQQDLLAEQAQLERKKADFDQSLALWTQLDTALKEAAAEVLIDLREKLLNPSTPKQEKWMNYQYAERIKRQAERIINYDFV